jgi:putative CocE/NonD family hydrolase
MKATLVPAVAAVLFLAGCVSGADVDEGQSDIVKKRAVPVVDLNDYSLTRPVYALKEIVGFTINGKGATPLQGHVYLPDAPQPYATILEYSPYFNGHQDPSDGRWEEMDGRRTMTGNHRPLLEAGYAVALVNLRGTGISGGCVQWGTQTDLDDVALVIETLAAKPWSNGKVGMIGTSYPGWTQFMAMAVAAQAPSLKATIPVSGLVDLYNLLGRNGATLSIGPVAMTQWHALYSFGEATYVPTDSRSGSPNRADCGPRASEDLQESVMLYGVGDRNDYWDQRDLREELKLSPVPTFFTNGLTDGEGHILQMEGLWDIFQHPNKRMMLGQWGHGGTNHPSGDWALMRVAWFDQFLHDGPPLLETGIVEYQDDLGNWHTSESWPPPSQYSTLHLSNGVITDSPDGVQASTQTFQSIHSNPCPALCTANLVATPNLPVCGPNQAVYVSPPLAEDVLVAGNFHVNITLTSNLPEGNLGVFLWRTNGSGACPDTDVREVRRALTDLRHATAPYGDVGKDFPINTPTGVNLASHPFASVLKAGERLVVAVGGGAVELTPGPLYATLTVTTGPTVQGSITIPVVEGNLRFA